MVVQHNISALNAHRQLSINNSQTNKNLEKLSSGFRINRAADDAAGLAISEKMRGQISGLNMASQNTSNAVQLIQTAEGGLNEVHEILHRMRELAVQSSNGTYDNDVDRYNLDKEMQALKSEIDRISMSTHYNGINLLDGTLGAEGVSAFPSGEIKILMIADPLNYESGSQYSIYSVLSEMGFPLSRTPSSGGVNGINGSVSLVTNSTFADQTATLFINQGTDIDGNPMAQFALQIGSETYTSQVSGNIYKFMNDSGQEVATLTCLDNNGSPQTVAPNMTAVISGIALDQWGNANLFSSVQYSGNPFFLNQVDDTHPLHSAIFGFEDTELLFQIGADGEKDQRVGLHVPNMSTACLGDFKATMFNSTGTLAEVSVASQDQANDAIDLIDFCVNQVSAVRADLGALQNRLDHTLNSLGVTAENLTAAESTIRDVDMAEEMMDFTKNSILIQASQAMLAQAQALPQGVLQLLQ